VKVSYPKAANAAHRCGFTLLEMIVVISIVVLLIALLLPAIHWAQEAAGSAACEANLRTLGQTTLIYANDNNGSLPYGTWSDPNLPLSNTNAVSGEWANLDFYTLESSTVPVNNDGVIGQNIPAQFAAKWDAIFWCPDKQIPMSGLWGVNYAANPNVFLTPTINSTTGYAADQSLLLGDIPDPSDVIGIGDTNQTAPNGSCTQYLFSWLPSQLSWQYGSYTPTTVIPPNPGNTDFAGTALSNQGLRYRHNSSGPESGDANAVFMDDHVESMQMNSVSVSNVIPGE
jgi:prepilin-type N-terminal cleavage/methylation domain-containing protein